MQTSCNGVCHEEKWCHSPVWWGHRTPIDSLHNAIFQTGQGRNEEPEKLKWILILTHINHNKVKMQRLLPVRCRRVLEASSRFQICAERLENSGNRMKVLTKREDQKSGSKGKQVKKKPKEICNGT